MKHETKALRKFKNKLSDSGLDEKSAVERAIMLLELYRDAVYGIGKRADLLRDDALALGSGDLDRALLFLADFAPEPDQKRFEDKVSSMYSSKELIAIIDAVFLRIRNYHTYGDAYYYILKRRYADKEKVTMEKLAMELHIDRSILYERKKEAEFLFAVCLFGCELSEIHSFIQRTNDQPEEIYTISLQNSDGLPTKSRHFPDGLPTKIRHFSDEVPTFVRL